MGFFVGRFHPRRFIAGFLAGVIVSFGLAPYLRFAYAVSDDRLRMACEQIVRACRRLSRP